MSFRRKAERVKEEYQQRNLRFHPQILSLMTSVHFIVHSIWVFCVCLRLALTFSRNATIEMGRKELRLTLSSCTQDNRCAARTNLAEICIFVSLLSLRIRCISAYVSRASRSAARQQVVCAAFETAMKRKIKFKSKCV